MKKDKQKAVHTGSARDGGPLRYEPLNVYDADFCFKAMVEMLPFVEDVKDAQSICDRVRLFVDDRTRPLRHAVAEWAREHGESFASGWNRLDRVWRYESRGITVTIDETGDTVKVNGVTLNKPVTPLSLKRALSRILKRRGVG